jgi:pimeloyl-ACP methyl ester carboxylesterase
VTEQYIEQDWTAGHLSGTLTAPPTKSRGPAALIIAGSGPTPRDGNCDTYRLLAHALAAAGIPSLRYDKRGVGKSAALVKREDELVIQTFAEDVVLVADTLREVENASSIVLIGHSEGALLATLAASRTKVAGVVLAAPSGRRLDVLMREQISALALPETQEHMRSEALTIIDKLAGGERVENVGSHLAALFRPSVQPFLISTFAIDPVEEFARSRVPALLLWGESDIQVGRSDLEALALARPDAKVVVFPNTNHMFKPAPKDTSDRDAQLASYDKQAPLVANFAAAIIAFIAAVVD